MGVSSVMLAGSLVVGVEVFVVGVFSVVPAGVSVVGVDHVVLLWFFCFFDLGVLPGVFDVEGKE